MSARTMWRCASAGAIGLLFNVLMVVIAIAAIIVTVPSEKQKDSEKTKHDEVAPPPIGN